jgi:hypothetical protein
MPVRYSCFAAAILLAYAVFEPSPARAGAVLITHGETISHLGDAVAPNQQQLPATKVGYKYGYWGVFWIDLWTWGGEYCLYEGQRFKPISRAEAARLLSRPESELGTPFLYKCPLGWLIFGPFIVLGIIARVLDKKQPPPENPVALLFQDARYQKAVEIMNEHYAKNKVAVPGGPGQEPSPEENNPNQQIFRAAFEAGVQHLLGQGIAREEAERNLALMVHTLASAPSSSSATGETGGEPPKHAECILFHLPGCSATEGNLTIPAVCSTLQFPANRVRHLRREPACPVGLISPWPSPPAWRCPAAPATPGRPPSTALPSSPRD